MTYRYDPNAPCKVEAKCPWGTRPVVGMWTQFEDRSQLFATDCLSRYTGCPRLHWTPAQWKNNPTYVRQK